MFNWLREILEIKYEFRERRNKLWKEQQQGSFEIEKDKKVCESCETLRTQLEIANYEKSQLLSKILQEPPVSKETPTTPIMINRPRNVPWRVRQQMLEKEDREKARLIREAPKPSTTVAAPSTTILPEKESTEDLEKELDVAEQQRESAG